MSEVIGSTQFLEYVVIFLMKKNETPRRCEVLFRDGEPQVPSSIGLISEL